MQHEQELRGTVSSFVTMKRDPQFPWNLSTELRTIAPDVHKMKSALGCQYREAIVGSFKSVLKSFIQQPFTAHCWGNTVKRLKVLALLELVV